MLSERPSVKYVPAFLRGMGKAMPKNDNLIVPHNSSLTYGVPTQIESTEVMDIVTQVERSINQLRDELRFAIYDL